LLLTKKKTRNIETKKFYKKYEKNLKNRNVQNISEKKYMIFVTPE